MLFAADLAPLEDPRLYQGDEVIRLDGSDPTFPDARIFDAESPLEIPARDDGPNPIVCPGWTHVAINESGSNAYAIDRCDGTLSIVDLEVPDTANGFTPVSSDRVDIGIIVVELYVNVGPPCDVPVDTSTPVVVVFRFNKTDHIISVLPCISLPVLP